MAYRAVLSTVGPGSIAAQVRSLPSHWRAVYTVSWMEHEVLNGGHHQFFWNSEGRLNSETLADLELIGAEAAAEIFRDALDVFESHDYVRRKARAEGSLIAFAASEPEGELSPLDQAFYALRKRPMKFLGRFIKAHVTLFA
jgi:hypothetical protein